MYDDERDWSNWSGPEHRWLNALEGFLDYLHDLGISLMAFGAFLAFLTYARSILQFVIPGAIDLH